MLMKSLAAIATLAMLGHPALASSIRYTLSSTGTGTFAGSAFTNAVVTVTLVGDTSTVVPDGNGLFNPGTGTVSVAGLGSATFTLSVGIVSTFDDLTLFGVPAVVIGQATDPSDPTSFTGILGQVGSELYGYDLQSAFGPDTGSGGPFSGSHMTPVFQTTAGTMTWAIGQPLGTSTFTAVFTPEPGTLLLLGAGLLFVGIARSYRGKKRLELSLGRACR